MGISSKYKREISVGGRPYLWFVADDDEHPFVPCSASLTVCTSDRTFLIRYPLKQPESYSHVVVLGPRFRMVQGLGGVWRRFRCPKFDLTDAVTPAVVRAVIEWCELETAPLREVDYTGEVLGPLPR